MHAAIPETEWNEGGAKDLGQGLGFMRLSSMHQARAYSPAFTVDFPSTIQLCNKTSI